MKAKLNMLENSGSFDLLVANSTKDLTDDIDKVIPIELIQISL